MTSASGRVLPVLGLFFLSPLVGEFLLGATSIDMLALLPVQALLYGGGTLLIREVVRRAGRGWWSILLLGAGYALLEEGLLDQLPFNPHYADSYDMVTVTYLPFLGTGVYGLLSVLAVHAVWSVTVPIALVEALVPERSGEPWLGRVGLGLATASFLLGIVVVGWGTFVERHFLAPWTRLSGTALTVIILIVAAFRIRRPRQHTTGRPAPRRLLVAATAFVLTSLFMLVLQPNWWGVAAALAVAAVALAIGLSWSRAPGWGLPHAFAAAAGATLTYSWIGFTQTPDTGSTGTV